MQKKIIALAIAGLASTAAFAQTNVTIYGIADASLSATTTLGDDKAALGQTTYRVNSGTLSTSRIGFKGVEDLGNGLKALFTLEYGLALDTSSPIGTSSTSSAVARQQFVGLTGGFGTVIAGHLQTTGLDFTVAGTALGGSTALGATNVLETANVGVIASNNARNLVSAQLGGRHSNAVAYVSPSFGGLTVAYNHARVTESANTTEVSDTHGDLLSASYANGPITAGAIYTRATDPGATANTSGWGLRGGYDFGVAKLQATYQRAKVQNAAADQKFVVSVSAPIGAKFAVIGEYGYLRVKSTGVGVADNVHAATLATTYALSKRTTAYAGIVGRRVTNGLVPTATNPAGDTNTYVVGLRHMF